MNRTLKQNSSLHLWFSQVSKALNEAGMDMRAVIKPEIDIMWSPYTVKEYLWKPVQEVYLGKKSTTELEKQDIDKIFDIINKVIGERTGIYVPFPSEDEINKYESKEKGKCW